jgi:hypothetical protein
VVWGVGLLACQLPASTMAGIGISANPPVESAEEAEETREDRGRRVRLLVVTSTQVGRRARRTVPVP